jgi:Ca-activated chloride channel family protein
MKKYIFLSILIISIFLITGCSNNDFVIVSGSENQALEDIIEDFNKDHNDFNIKMDYMGSIDIMHQLQKDEVDADAVWPANSLWISMGDENNKVKYSESIMTSPVVFGIKKSLATELGFLDKEITINDIIEAIKNDKLDFIMTSATQSNSGATAYLGFINAILGNPDSISSNDLKNNDFQENIKDLLLGIDRSSGSSAWLKDLYIKGDYNSMVNYESLIIETNKELVSEGKEPLYAIYPKDGIVTSDSPLGFVEKNDNTEKEKFFKEFQEYLLSNETQAKINDLGRRTGVGSKLTNNGVYDETWGIDSDNNLSSFNLPKADIIKEALNLYQTKLKKPSYTVFCLDYSSSMEGDGIEELKEAMEMVLDEEKSEEYLIQSSTDDITVIIPFNEGIIDIWEGTNSQLLTTIKDSNPDGRTDIYNAAIEGMSILNNESSDKYIRSIVLMTDGVSNGYTDFQDLQTEWNSYNQDIPIFSILFGDASKDQLEEIVSLTNSKIFDGEDDLVEVFREVRGYN